MTVWYFNYIMHLNVCTTVPGTSSVVWARGRACSLQKNMFQQSQSVLSWRPGL